MRQLRVRALRGGPCFLFPSPKIHAALAMAPALSAAAASCNTKSRVSGTAVTMDESRISSGQVPSVELPEMRHINATGYVADHDDNCHCRRFLARA